MFKNESFSDFIEYASNEIIKIDNIEEAFNKLSYIITKYYRNSSIRFAEKFGKRMSYIAGSGNKMFIEAEKIKLSDKYFVFLENFTFNSEKEKDNFILLLKKVTSI